MFHLLGALPVPNSKIRDIRGFYLEEVTIRNDQASE